jgi:hypothetical protein
MKNRNSLALALLTIGALATMPAAAEDYRVTGNADTLCTGTKSDIMTLDGPRDVWLTQKHDEQSDVTICVPDDSPGNAFVQWEAAGYWKASGIMRNGCAEIQGARSVKIRAVETNFHDTATYYTCSK